MSGYGFIISELAQPISNYKTLFLFFFFSSLMLTTTCLTRPGTALE